MPQEPAYPAPIDVMNLHVEWASQEEYRINWSDYFAECKRDIAVLENQLKQTRATLAREIRADPIRFGYNKATDDIVEAAVEEQDALIDLRKEIVDAKFVADKATGRLSAIDDRRRAIHDMVTLYGLDYFAAPTAGDPATRAGIQHLQKAQLRQGSMRQNVKTDIEEQIEETIEE